MTDFHFHDFRHTFASWLIMRGVPLATVSNLLGHTSPTMTLRYAHLSPKHLTSAVRVLDSAILPGLKAHSSMSKATTTSPVRG